MKKRKSPEEQVRNNEIVRCAWVGHNKPFYEKYHDEEWGEPVHDDTKLFEMLILEGAQAGLSWETILKKRSGYRKTFLQFNPRKLAAVTDDFLDNCLCSPEIVRNRLKVYSVRKNALSFLAIQEEFGSFDTYLWSYVQNTPIKNRWRSIKELPSSSPLSDAISKDLKKRGMSFVGTTIIYAFLQAVGVVQDHTVDCWKFEN